MKYEIFEHTADVGIKVFGDSYDEIFNNSVRAFSDLMMDTANFRKNRKREIRLNSNSPDLLLVDLLSLILYDFEAEGVLYFESDLHFEQDLDSLSGILWGDFPEENADYRNVIKAVTYHGLSMSPEKGFATVIFDI